jgi:hypothetical protein
MPFFPLGIAFAAVDATFTHLSTAPDLVHLYFALFVVCTIPAFKHFPLDVAASTGKTPIITDPTRKSPAMSAKR